MKTIKKFVLITFPLFILLSGCVKFPSGIRPIYPPSTYLGKPIVIDSLQPTFEWKAYSISNKDENLRYDLMVFEAEKKGGGQLIIYEAKELVETQHKIPMQLKPSYLYGWRLKPKYLKEGKQIEGEWNSFGHIGGIPPFLIGWRFNIPYLFKTPPNNKDIRKADANQNKLYKNSAL